MATKKVATTVNKSAITGQFVSQKTVQKNPGTTYKQTVVKQPKPKRQIGWQPEQSGCFNSLFALLYFVALLYLKGHKNAIKQKLDKDMTAISIHMRYSYDN